MIDASTRITTDEYHTGGEPYRIVTGGVPTPQGRTVLDRREWSEQHLDDVRAFLVNEPRGHADMYGCFVTPPDPDDDHDDHHHYNDDHDHDDHDDHDDDDDHDGDRRGDHDGRAGAFGMVFFHKDGFSTACGHGTIAGVTWAIETGRVAATEPTTEVVVDVPSGRLRAVADVDAGRVLAVRFENVPSFVSATDLQVDVDGLTYTIDVSYGGAFYASADVAQLGCPITPEHLPELIEIGRRIKWAVDGLSSTDHPTDRRLSGCYGTIWFERLGTDDDGTLRQRNVTIFADGEVDRSPCGSGTSARLALLDHRGELARGATLRHESIVGSEFTGRVSGAGEPVADHPSVRTEIGGRAHCTGAAAFTFDPDDALGTGFQLR